MRLNIRLCRHCTRAKEDCEYRKAIKDKVSAIEHPGTVSHNCPVYKTVWPLDTRVQIELKTLAVEEEVEWDDNAHCDRPIGVTGSWKSLGWVAGTIAGECRGYFTVRLDTPAEICLPERNRGWDTARPVTITHTRRRANKIKESPDA